MLLRTNEKFDNHNGNDSKYAKSMLISNLKSFSEMTLLIDLNGIQRSLSFGFGFVSISTVRANLESNIEWRTILRKHFLTNDFACRLAQHKTAGKQSAQICSIELWQCRPDRHCWFALRCAPRVWSPQACKGSQQLVC